MQFAAFFNIMFGKIRFFFDWFEESVVPLWFVLYINPTVTCHFKS